MKQMVLMVLNNPDHSMTLMEAWEKAGAPGITILESTGLVRIRQAMGMRDDMPLMPSLSHLFRSAEEHHRTLFTVVDNEAQAQAVLEATAEAFKQLEAEDLDESCVIFTLPVNTATNFATSRAKAKMTGN